MGTKIGVGWTKKSQNGTTMIQPKFNSEILPFTLHEHQALSFVRKQVTSENIPDWDIYVEDMRKWEQNKQEQKQGYVQQDL